MLHDAGTSLSLYFLHSGTSASKAEGSGVQKRSVTKRSEGERSVSVAILVFRGQSYILGGVDLPPARGCVCV